MKVIHIFISFPNQYQPYNIKLLERLNEGDIESIPVSLANTASNASQRTIYLNHSFRNNLLFILRFVLNYRTVLQFSNIFGYSIKESIKIFGRFYPLLRLNAKLFHIHHIQVLNNGFLNFLNFFGIKWVVSLRGFDIAIKPLLNSENYLFVVNALKQSNGIHTVSESLRQRAISMGIESSKIRTIYRTVEVDEPIQRRANYEESPYIITTIARMDWKKGYVFALLAVKKMLEENIPVIYHICGSGKDEDFSEIVYWINLLSIEENIVLHGFLNTNQLDQILAITHVYLQPSISEGIPNTLIRAAINRIPIVATHVGGIPEIIKNEENGILIRPGSPEEIVLAIKRIIFDERLRERMINHDLSSNWTDPEIEIESYRKFYSYIFLQ